MRLLRINMLFWAVAAAGVPAAVRGQVEEVSRDAQAQGRQAFRSAPPFPWYDSSSDTLRPIRLPAEPGPATSPGTAGGGGRAAGPGRALNVLAWSVLLVALGLLVLLLVRAYRERERRAVPPGGARRAETDAADHLRLEELPYLARRAQRDLLGQAQRCYQAGDYGEAIVYLFSYQLVELDRRGLLRLDKGKTNRQYVRELRHHRTLAELLTQTMVGFEAVYFGNHGLDRAGFEACWHRLGEFQAQAQAVPA
jgi:hypothetical protein